MPTRLEMHGKEGFIFYDCNVHAVDDPHELCLKVTRGDPYKLVLVETNGVAELEKVEWGDPRPGLPVPHIEILHDKYIILPEVRFKNSSCAGSHEFPLILARTKRRRRRKKQGPVVQEGRTPDFD